MSKVRADQYTNKEGTGAPSFPNGVSVTGVLTATSFSGSLAGTASNATVAVNAQGLTGSPNISVGTITASGSVSIGGTLTYEDVTNIDSVGIITARSGVDFGGILREKVKVTAGKLSDNTNINLDNGMVHFFTTQETTTSIPNITSSVGINTIMAVGDTMTVSVITTAAAGAYLSLIHI